MKFTTTLVSFPLLLLALLPGCGKQPAGGANQITFVNRGLATTAELPDTAGWESQALRRLEEKAYEIVYNEKAKNYSSLNLHQDMQATYGGNLMTLTSGAGEEKGWTLNLQLHGIYAGPVLQYDASGSAQASVSGNTINFDHNGAFTVQYINSAEGVRQNFIVQQQPKSAGNLAVRLSVDKDWEIKKAGNGELHFMRERSGGELRKEITYHSLKAWDAQNKELEAKFTVPEGSQDFLILVNTNDAVYPVTIDPLSTTADWEVQTETSGMFGRSISSAGDVNGDGYSDVIVGEPLYSTDVAGDSGEGRVHLFYGSVSGLSTIAGWTATGDLAKEGFGESVACAGDVNGDGYSDVIIGAPGYANGETDEGGAYLYYGSATGLQSTPAIILGSNQAGARMGWNVAGAGDLNGDGYSDVMVASVNYANGPYTDAGAVFIYYGSGTGVAATPAIILKGLQQGQLFGFSISAGGDINGDGYGDLAIGSPRHDFVGTDEGSVSVYYGSSAGITEDNKYLMAGYQTHGQFGHSVSGLGDTNGDGFSDVMISVPGYANGQSSEGAVFLYYGRSFGLMGTYSWMYESNRIDARVGATVAAAGDVDGDGYADALVSMHNDSVYLFKGSASGLKNQPGWRDGMPATDTYYGYAMGCAGDVNGDGYSDVVAGMYAASKARGYYGSPNSLETTPVNVYSLSQSNANFGGKVSSAGDVNGDGYDDVIVSAIFYDNGFTDQGAVFVYYGSANGLPTAPSWSTTLNHNYAALGVGATGAGDVNGDGYDDIIVSASWYSLTLSDISYVYNSQEGKVLVYFGSPTGLSDLPAWEKTGQAPGMSLGAQLAGLGDVNGDGYSDVAIGSPFADNDKGVAYVYYGSATGLSDDPDWQYQGTGKLQFGSSMAGGDWNGDGYADLVVCAVYPAYDGTSNIYIFQGSKDGISPTPNFTIKHATSTSAHYSVTCAGDINGDGFSDMAIGYSNGTCCVGRVLIHYGSASGISATPGTTVFDNNNSSAMGWSVSGAGDVNGDGYSDIIAGAIDFDNSHEEEGAACIFLGGSSGLSTTASWMVEGNRYNAHRGSSVSGAGDVNGDGLSDFIVGEPGYNDASTQIGYAYLYVSNPAGAVRSNLRLYNVDLSTPIQQINYHDASFGAGLFVKSPMGRVKARLVWEAVPQGAAFSGGNGTGYTGRKTDFTDLGTLGLELKTLIAKAGKQTKLRVRVEYQKAGSINGQVYGPWRYPSGYMQGAHGMGSTPLPVKLERFTAKYQQRGEVLLEWRSAMEENSHSFEIQQSLDGNAFTTVGRVTAAGSAYSYHYTDHGVNSLGIRRIYYRLRMVDIDQSAELSQVVPVELPQSGSFAIRNAFPNPAGAYINITIESPQADNTVFITFDAVGRQVKQQRVFVVQGTQTINMNTADLPAGLYVLRVQSGSSKRTRELRFMKR
jgi:hypothetical protein